MASLIKQSGWYYLQFYDKARRPKRKKVALRATRKKDARVKQRELESAYVQGTFNPWTDDPFNYDTPGHPETQTLPAREAVSRFLQTKRDSGYAESTVTTYEKILTRLVGRAEAETPLDALTAAHIEAEVHAQGISPATARKRYTHVRAFLRWADGANVKAPLHALEKVSRPKRPSKRPKHVTAEELEAICKTLREDYAEKLEEGKITEGQIIWLEPLFRFAFLTGLRGSELARLRWRDLDTGRGLILLSDEQKSKEEGTSPLIPQAAEVLEDVPDRDPDEYVFHAPGGEAYDRRTDTFRDYVNRRFRRYRRKAGIDRPLSMHGLRHGFATRLAQKGVAPQTIQRACRHKAYRTTQKYVALAAADVIDAVSDAMG